MTNKKNHRKRIRFLAILLLITGISFTTLAYYTATAKSPTKFDNVSELNSSQGGIKLSIEEPLWNALSERKAGQLYLKPGETYPKDPTVTVLKNNSSAFVFMSIDHNLYSNQESLLEEIEISKTDWAEIDTSAIKILSNPLLKNKKVYMYIGAKGLEVDSMKNHKLIPTSEENLKLPPLFTEIKAKDNFSTEVLNDGLPFMIDVDAFAHQATVEDHTAKTVGIPDLIKPATRAALDFFFSE